MSVLPIFNKPKLYKTISRIIPSTEHYYNIFVDNTLNFLNFNTQFSRTFVLLWVTLWILWITLFYLLYTKKKTAIKKPLIRRFLLIYNYFLHNNKIVGISVNKIKFKLWVILWILWIKYPLPPNIHLQRP